jgi:hypothetical protein
MPRIKDIKPHLKEITNELSQVEGVTSLFVWGSYADNIEKPNTRIKDLDIIAKTIFHSGDLLSIDNDIIKQNASNEYLMEQGFNPSAIIFSNDFLKFNKYDIDRWALSSDNILLHWGPIPSNQEEAIEIKKEAENHAVFITGVPKKKINSSVEDVRTNWYETYYDFMTKYFSDMPTGWYQSEEKDLNKILNKSIKLT